MKLSLIIMMALFLMTVAVTPDTLNASAPAPLPLDFWWGTSLAAHQSEGGNHNSWSVFEGQPGHIKNGEISGRAADHWNFYEKDFDNLVWLHANTHRFSIEWSRLEPAPGQWNEAAAQHYRQMIMALKKRSIRPVVCLFHFTLPIWAADKGGFENDEVVKAFVRFSEHAQQSFGDLVADWLTMNEPIVYALAAYGAGLTPPGVKDFKRVARVVANLMHANGSVYHSLKKMNPGNTVSFAHHLRGFTPKNSFNPLDHLAVHFADQFVNWSWFDAIKKGRVQLWLPFQLSLDEACPECTGAMDYIGLNYYSRDLISFNIRDKAMVQIATASEGVKTDLGWEVYPQGLTQGLEKIKSKGLGTYSILITENGLADAHDRLRSQFIYDHVSTLLRDGEKLGLKIKGYLHWSLIDNFEWIEGFEPRFGLFEVDYKTFKRTPRPSAYYFRQVGQSRQLLPPPAQTE